MAHDFLKLDNQLCFRLYAVSRKMTRAYQPHLDKFNLTYPQYIVLLVLFENKKLDFKKLSEIVDLKTGTLTPIVQKLEEYGFVLKQKNENDQRKIDVILTEKGEELEQQIIEVPINMGSELAITEDMYHILVKELDSLSKILSNINVKK